MFLVDSLSCRKTEPTWFGILRCVFAILLTCIILKLSIYDDFNKITHEANIIKHDVPKDSKLKIEMSFCANNAMEVYARGFPLNDLNGKNITFKTSERCILYSIPILIPNFASNKRANGIWVDIKFPLNSINNSTINNNQLNDIINSYFTDKLMIYRTDISTDSSILPNNYLRLTMNMSLPILDNNCVGYSPKTFYFYSGQAFFIHITPSIVSYLDSCDIKLDVQSEQLPLNFDTSRIGLGFYIYFPFRYNSVEPYDFTDYLSDVGGFYNSIAETFVFFFGSEKLGPWGIAHIFILSSIPCIRSFGRKLAWVYVSPGGIPLVEKVEKRPGRDKDFNKSLEKRVQILETLLKEYYLDDYYLDKIKFFADNRKKLNTGEVLDEEKAEEKINPDNKTRHRQKSKNKG